MTNLIEISNKVRAIRKKLDLSQTEFAEKIGVQRSNLSAIESGKRNITIEMLIAMHHAFNISINWLLVDKGEMIVNQEEPSKKEEDLEAIIDRKIKEALANIAS